MPQAASSDTDDSLAGDPCPVLTLATVRPDARTTMWYKLFPEMEGWFSQLDFRRLRTARSSLEALVFPTEPQRTKHEPIPSGCLLCGQPSCSPTAFHNSSVLLQP